MFILFYIKKINLIVVPRSRYFICKVGASKSMNKSWIQKVYLTFDLGLNILFSLF
jgi:hypothetical protein